MPVADAANALASAVIGLLRWWTLLAPLGMLAALVLQTQGRRTAALIVTIVTVLPPLLFLSPVAAMGSGATRVAAATAAIVDAGALVIAAAALAQAARGRAGAARFARAAPVVGLVGCMLGALVLLIAISV